MNQLNTDNDKQEPLTEQKPDDKTGVYVRGFIKISDPDSGEVLVETAQ